MKFSFFQIIVFYIWSIAAAPPEILSPDTRKLYHDIGAGRGLYTSFDKVTVLNVTTFNETVYNTHRPKTWVIEFYNSWCGHCHRFAPTWKSLASDILGWQDVLGVGAVDCSNNYNTPVCREYEILYYPTIKYFPAHSSVSFLGTPVPQNTVENLKYTIIDAYREDLKAGRTSRPSILPFEGQSLKSIWEAVPESILYTVLVIEDETSYTGAQLAFDLVSISSIQTKLALVSNINITKRFRVQEVPAVFLCERVNMVREIIPLVRNRTSFYYALKDVFGKKGITLADLQFRTTEEYENADVPTILELMQIDQKIKEKLNLNDLDDAVSFQYDLEAALKYSFYNEITSHKIIPPSSLEALKLYLKVLAKHFPFGKQGVKYLHHIKNDIKNMTHLTGQKFEEIVLKYEKQFEPVFLSKNEGWLGCRGSKPTYRGFPCSLWMMFHTLTVYAECNMYVNESPHEVLRAISGYVQHFFGCTTCAEHFLAMAVTFPGNVSNHDDAILWLWKAHNSANDRLKGDPTTDPEHPKVQFPSPRSCPSCRNDDDSWDEDEVLSFLKAMYRNISYLTLEDLTEANDPDKPPTKRDPSSRVPAKRDTHKVRYNAKLSINDDSNRTWDLNIFDVSLCFFVYFISSAIVLLGFYKFYFRKSHRKKNWGFDFYNSA